MAGLLDGWNPTVTPAPQAPAAPGGGLFSSFGDSLNSAISNPAFQFGIGMAGAGGQGQGLGGGLLGGTAGAQNAFKIAQQQRELQAQKQRDSFIASLSDPNNPIAKNFSPETIAALKGLPPDQSSGLLAQLLTKKGDLEQMKSIAQINANATIGAKNAELKYQRDYDRENTARVLDMLRSQYQGGQPGQGGAPAGGSVPSVPQGQPPMPGARLAPDGKWYIADPNQPGKYLMVQP